ncbi:hypothetical protein HYX18_02460 [Candidatus Woesearchaeota archaeon]|nr:hypothetical protein [Candidatus Woesearchaeota archaeon]
MSHKLAYTITPIVFVLILLLPSIKPQEQQINFVLDEANIITNDEELNILITDLNSYKNSNAQIIIFTSTDEEKIKARLEQGFYLYNLEKINGNLQSNLNILIVFNPSWTRPAIIYASSNCGLDINRIKLALDEQSIFYGQEEKQVPFLEYFYNQDYDAGFKGMVQFLVDEIKLKIDEQTCIIPQSFNQEIKPELFPDIEPIEILKTDLQRINTYQAYYELSSIL